MKISGIIVEYNPLHNGHVYHIKETKKLTKCDGLIAVLSGNFTQRGIPSVIDKYIKTEMALNNDVDLVLELPTIYSVSSAEFFSFGAISLLNSLNIVDSICFGSECGDISKLKEISSILAIEPYEFKLILKENLQKGIPFATARSRSLIEYLKLKNTLSEEDENSISNILNSSNNILGIEYIKSLVKLNSNITPYTIERKGGSYNSSTLNSVFSSATSIRNFLKGREDLNILKGHIPDSELEMLKNLKNFNYDFAFDDKILPYIKFKNFTNPNSLEKLPDASEGLHNKISKVLNEGNNYYDIINTIKSKRYTQTRITRILCEYFIGFDNFHINTMRKLPCSYGRILGFNNKGKEILKLMKKNSSIPLHTKFPKALDDTLKLELQSSKAYSLINKNYRFNEDFLRSPIIK